MLVPGTKELIGCAAKREPVLGVLSTMDSFHDRRGTAGEKGRDDMLRRVFLAVLVVWILVPGIPKSLHAQGSPGSIEGQITDSQQRVVAQATAQVEDASGKVIATATADESGHYVLSSVPPGTYKLHFTQIGFQSLDQGAVTVESGK